ncbi:RND efflux system, membrane fusion protein [Desulfosarcina cetonica]|uniref:efflux RND transporter periplasmic adaptor subunit n=1 Tax=Desulfosarcina cetonica TaxID=90730 RepID=UPI0006D21630|nr:efflux RND transporter periplasmic adaptor subunit [Desulfosarcina cetonica]VTR67857.1 RND efflux system, membrane fusion protein [Desulfosarcina cetonica]
MKKRFVLILVLLLVAAAALMLLKKRKAELAQAAPAPVLPAVVASMDLKAQPVTLTLPAMGVVASDISAVLSTRITGRITKVLKREGETVHEGELIALVDNGELEAKRRSLLAKRDGIDAEIEAQRQAHQRTLELFKVKGASLEQKQQEEAAIERLVRERESLMQGVKEIEELSSYARILAPASGTLSQVMVSPGDLATPGKPLFRISSKAGLYLNLSLPSSLPAANITLQGHLLPLTSKEQTGDTGLVQYVAPLPPDTGLVEGEYANVNVIVYQGEGVLLPVDALLTLDDSASVFVLSADGKAERLRVTITARGVEGVTVEQNLSGRRVIVAKPDILLRVAAGVPVTISNV